MIALTGPLGAGKTTVLNTVLRTPGARLGVVINDFGSLDVDSVLVTGQIDEASAITGGCLCCLPDHDGLDTALERLARPELRLDAIVVEASGVAEPRAVARLIRFTGARGTRPGGVVDLVDASAPPDLGPAGSPVSPTATARFDAASLVLLTRTEHLPDAERRRVLTELTAALHAHRPDLPVIEAPRGAVDPRLVLDVASAQDDPGTLPLAELLRAEHPLPAHVHADAVSETAAGAVDAGAVLDLLESPPAGVHRLKGLIGIDTGRSVRRYAVHLVGRHVHVDAAPPGGTDGLVAIGVHIDHEAVRAALRRALAPACRSAPDDLRRLFRYRRLSG